MEYFASSKTTYLSNNDIETGGDFDEEALNLGKTDADSDSYEDEDGVEDSGKAFGETEDDTDGRDDLRSDRLAAGLDESLPDQYRDKTEAGTGLSQSSFSSENQLPSPGGAARASAIGAPTILPNETNFTSGSLWGFYGDTSLPANPFGSQAAEAWIQNQVGTSTNVVGVIDSGVDYTHPDLYLNVWLNQLELPAFSFADVNADGLITFRDLNDVANASFVSDLNGTGYIDAGDLLADSRWANGVDNDANGYTDDLIGWDFVNNDNNPMDDVGHGTHVSGTIGALGGNGLGVAGVNWDVQIMPLKFLDSTNRGWVFNAASATDYFTNASLQDGGKSNFVATNNSWSSGNYQDPALGAAILRAAQQGILYVAAAGNGGLDALGDNNDVSPDFPSGYSTLTGAGFEAVISVASLTETGALSFFSNFGAAAVDLAAPGQGVLSTFTGNQYAIYSGTSMATAFVTGAAALYAARNPAATASQISAALLSSSAPTASLTGKVATGGRLDIGALMGVGSPSQSLPDLAATSLTFSGYTATYALRNIGQQGAPGTNTGIYLSTDATITTADSLIGSAPSLSLLPNETRAESASVTLPGGLRAGLYYIGVIANNDWRAAEIAAANNVSNVRAVYIGTDAANTLNGSTQADVMFGLNGNDVYVFNNLLDTAGELAGGGVDTVQASVVIDALGSNIENLVLTGSAASGVGNGLNNVMTGNRVANTLTGLGGDDTLDGGAGADAMIGGAGNDSYVLDNAGDRVVEAVNEGIDTVRSSVTVSALFANVENLTLTGGSAINATGNDLDNVIAGNGAANTINGLSGNNTLIGGGGNDTLIGGAGIDLITGGTGRDTQTGGAGADVFIFSALGDLGNSTTTRDTIADFAPGQDLIDLAGVDANAGVTGNQSFTFIGASNFSGPGQLRYAGGILYGNVNTNLSSDFQIALTGAPALAAGNIIL